jgi:hypothetical protein
MKLKLDEREYNLDVVSGEKAGSSGGIGTDDASLALRSNGSSQVLYSLRGSGEPTEAWWYLLWAGDLDRDGKLDLLVTVSDHYNVAEQVLFLSSAAGAGGLVGEVARLRTTGC